MCVVDHSKEFHYVGEFVFGATPDKSMCNTDPFLNEVEGGKYRDTRFFTLDEEREVATVSWWLFHHRCWDDKASLLRRPDEAKGIS